jgi:hypothetical protein
MSDTCGWLSGWRERRKRLPGQVLEWRASDSHRDYPACRPTVLDGAASGLKAPSGPRTIAPVPTPYSTACHRPCIHRRSRSPCLDRRKRWRQLLDTANGLPALTPPARARCGVLPTTVASRPRGRAVRVVASSRADLRASCSSRAVRLAPRGEIDAGAKRSPPRTRPFGRSLRQPLSFRQPVVC